jgi:DUF1680 family protein
MRPISRRTALQLLAAASAVPALGARASAPDVRVPAALQPLARGAVGLGGMLGRRVAANVERRLLRVDAEALLACFTARDSADGLDRAWVGEHAGKFLDAACRSLGHEPRADLRRIVDRVATGLIASQAADGYLGTYPAERRWSGWDVWVHKYTLIGLLSYYELSADAPALHACERILALLTATFGDGPGQRDIVAAGEHMGMAATSVLEPVCRLYLLGGDPRALDFGRYIVRAYDHPGGPGLVRSLLGHGSVYRTANGKAYEMLSNLVGLVDLYRLTGDDPLLRAVEAAWRDICANQLYATGTVSAGEHFQPPPRRLAYPASNVGETCATVTWLQLNARLLELTGEARFGAEIERSVYNHLLAAQDERSGDISYYTALSGRKEWSHHLVCCVSSGPRGLALLPDLAWALAPGALVVNLYVPGRAAFAIDGTAVGVSVATRFPEDGEVLLRITPERPVRFTVRLRVPDWAVAFEATCGTLTQRGTAGQFLDVTRTWQPGSTLRIRMDLPVAALDGAPTYPDRRALRRGPQVLALERSLNPSLADLHRSVLPPRPVLAPVTPPHDWAGIPAYRVHGRAGVPAADGRLDYDAHDLVLVPFADAREQRVYALRDDAERSDRPAATAYARAWISTAPWLAAPGASHPDTDRPEALTDENPDTYCIVDPRDPNLSMLAGGVPGRGGDAVWLAVTLDAPAPIRRVVFRHGPLAATGGWFDTSAGPPRIEVARAPVPTWRDAPYPDPGQVAWEDVAALPYPATGPATPPPITRGQAFALELAEPVLCYGIRIVGRPGGTFVSCAQLSGFTA